MLTASGLRTALLGLLVCGLLALPSNGQARAQVDSDNCGDSSAPYGVVQIDTFPRLDLELARTPREHEVGLMYREYLPPDSGMLFVYQAGSREGYWMYHTLIPLSIAWIGQDGTIYDIKDMPRLDDPDDQQQAALKVYSPEPSTPPYWFALEVNQGWFVQHGVGVGQQILFCLGSS